MINPYAKGKARGAASQALGAESSSRNLSQPKNDPSSQAVSSAATTTDKPLQQPSSTASTIKNSMTTSSAAAAVQPATVISNKPRPLPAVDAKTKLQRELQQLQRARKIQLLQLEEEKKRKKAQKQRRKDLKAGRIVAADVATPSEPPSTTPDAATDKQQLCTATKVTTDTTPKKYLPAVTPATTVSSVPSSSSVGVNDTKDVCLLVETPQVLPAKSNIATQLATNIIASTVHKPADVRLAAVASCQPPRATNQMTTQPLGFGIYSPYLLTPTMLSYMSLGGSATTPGKANTKSEQDFSLMVSHYQQQLQHLPPPQQEYLATQWALSCALPEIPPPPPVVSRHNASAATASTTLPQPAAPALTIDQAMDLFADCILDAIMDRERVIGAPITRNELQEQVNKRQAIAHVPLANLVAWWKNVKVQVETSLSTRAQEHWRTEWTGQPPSHHLTDAQRHALQGQPRPYQGCKCGSTTHRRVNHPSCPLYSHLSRQDEEMPSPASPMRQQLQKQLPMKELNKVEAAMCERYVRQKEEEAEDLKEVSFVVRMEQLQIKERGQALDTPSLTTMVLSAILELQGTFSEIRHRSMELEPLKISIEPQPAAEKPPVASTRDADADDGDDSDDDDVPLSDLGKRNARREVGLQEKRRRLGSPLHLECLEVLVRRLGEKWGHCFQEPSHVDYCWRWEVFHGEQRLKSRWLAHRGNPRTPGIKSLENLGFVNIIGSSPEEIALARKKMLCHVLSPTRTSIGEELLALIADDVLNVDKFGIPVPNKYWYSKVCKGLLDDMLHLCGVAADPAGRFGVAGLLRKTIKRKWTMQSNGWALNKDSSLIVYDSEEYGLWRKALRKKFEQHSSAKEGIERFGL